MWKIIFITFTLVYSGILAAKLPKTWTRCKRSDPKYEECLKKAVQHAAHELKNGNSVLGVLPIDPLRISKIVIDQGEGPVTIKLTLEDLDITGLGKLEVKNIKTDWKEMRFDVIVPNERFIGKYSINGKVLALPIVGNGTCEIVVDKHLATIIINFKQIEKNNKKYFEVIKMQVLSKMEKTTFNFGNLFNGDKALGDTMNLFLNENWKEIIEELNPALSKSFGAAFQQVANRVFSQIPVEEITTA